MTLCSLPPLVLGARGRLCSLSTCCLSPGVLREAPSRVQGKGMSVEFVSCARWDKSVWIHMHGPGFTLKS